MRKLSLVLLLLSAVFITTSHARAHQDTSGGQSSQETQAPQQTQQTQETQAPQQTQKSQETQAPQQTQAPQTQSPQTQQPETQAPQTQAPATQPSQETQAPATQPSQETQAPATQPSQETQAPATRPSQETQTPATQPSQETQAPATQPSQETQAPATQSSQQPQSPETQAPQQTQQSEQPQSSENQGSQSSSEQQVDISKSGEIFYGAMLAGESKCDVNSRANSVQLPEFLVGSGRVEISSGAGYLGAISAMTSTLEEKVKAVSMSSDLLSVLLPKAIISKLQSDFQSGCNSQSTPGSEQNNQTQGNSGGSKGGDNQGSNSKGGINKRQAGASNQNCNLLESFITFDANVEIQARASLQDFSPVSSPNGLRENPNDPKEQLFIAPNLWGLVVDRLLVFLGGERINPTLTSHWKNVVKTQWLSLNDSSLIDLEMLAMWAFATDDVSEEWDSTLSFRYEALSIRGKIFYAFYLKNRNVNAGLAGVTLARERIDLYQNVLKLAMDRIRIDHFGNTAFVTVADFPDGPERPDYQATAMLLILISKFGIPFDLKPTKMANFLANFGRQGDLEFPIEKFKAFNNSREVAWALVALATRQITLDVDLELRVVSDNQEVLRHQFKRCCDTFVKTSYSRLVEISAGKTISFVACGSGDISVALRFIWDVNQNNSVSASSSSSSSSSPESSSTQTQDQSTQPQDQSTQSSMDQSQSSSSEGNQGQDQSTQTQMSQDQSQGSVGQDQVGQGN